tara:strand:+ start:104 stop:1408 length:1305 start_codon:yes stop_codon:yes gene_type:complete
MKYPFSENLQRGVLYLLKTNQDFHIQISSLIKPEYFEFPHHTKLFNIVRDYYDEYLTLPNDEIILEEVRKNKDSQEAFSDYEDELYRINHIDTSSIESPAYIMDMVEDFAKKAAMKEAIKQSMVLLREENMGEIESLVRDALTVSRTVDYGQEYFSNIEERWRRVLTVDSSKRYSVFLPKLDEVLEGGLSSKELAMVVAPPGVGKSLFLVNQAYNSMKEGRKVLYISLEMSEDKIAQRFDSIMATMPQSNLVEEQDRLFKRLHMFSKKYPQGQLIIKQFPTGMATVNDVRALLVQLRNYEHFEPTLIIVDYLELLRPTTEGMAEYQAQQRISEELRGLAVENDCLVWTATQTNRQGRRVKLITDAELADAYGKVRTCDLAVSLNQSEEEFDNHTMRAYVMKSRNSQQRFIIPMEIDYNTLQMYESYAEVDEDDE